jgi:hypothetical protein
VLGTPPYVVYGVESALLDSPIARKRAIASPPGDVSARAFL